MTLEQPDNKPEYNPAPAVLHQHSSQLHTCWSPQPATEATAVAAVAS